MGLTYADIELTSCGDLEMVHRGQMDQDEVKRITVSMLTCNAFVLPGDSEPLLGAIPMEEMDVIIHPNRNELIAHPDHPDFPVLKMTTLLTPKSDK